MTVGILYGSTTGNTAETARHIGLCLSPLANVEVRDIASTDVSELSAYDALILGASTWGVGDMQDDWDPKAGLDGLDLSGKKVALFGFGDQAGYGDTFVDAIGLLAESAEKAGATLIGRWPTDGYDFEASRAVRDGDFVGLPLDADNQDDQTPDRVSRWVALLVKELGL